MPLEIATMTRCVTLRAQCLEQLVHAVEIGLGVRNLATELRPARGRAALQTRVTAASTG